MPVLSRCGWILIAGVIGFGTVLPAVGEEVGVETLRKQEAALRAKAAAEDRLLHYYISRTVPAKSPTPAAVARSLRDFYLLKADRIAERIRRSEGKSKSTSTAVDGKTTPEKAELLRRVQELERQIAQLP